MNQIQIFMPPPTNWQDFENLVFEIARVKYVSESVQKFARQGQRQNGVDVYAENTSDKKIGIQCKETKKKGLTNQIIDREISNVEHFTPKLDFFIIATTQKTEKKIQEYINQINDSKKNSFKVQVWFWDDINREINLSQNVMFYFYKSYSDEFNVDDIEIHLSSLRLAFDRPAFKDNFLHEGDYNNFEEALRDTKAMIKTGFLYDRQAKNLIVQVIPCDYIGDKPYQEFVQKTEKLLEQIYQKFMKDKKASQKNPKQFEEVAGTYNISRRSLIGVINKELKTRGQTAIDINY
jgi:hypothetical protein